MYAEYKFPPTALVMLFCYTVTISDLGLMTALSGMHGRLLRPGFLPVGPHPSSYSALSQCLSKCYRRPPRHKLCAHAHCLFLYTNVPGSGYVSSFVCSRCDTLLVMVRRRLSFLPSRGKADTHLHHCKSGLLLSTCKIVKGRVISACRIVA